MNKDELLKEAKRRYPIGTKVLCLTDNTPEIIKSELVWLDSERIAQTGGIGTRVYKNGKWAEIVSEAEDNHKFEVGKWYKSNFGFYLKPYRIEGNYSLSGADYICDKGKYNYNSSGRDNLNNWEKLTDLSEIQQYLPDGHPDKIKIIEVNTFKRGDYIVTLKGDFALTVCAKENYCFKINSTCKYMDVEQTIRSNSSDSNGSLTFDKTIRLHDWRYATLEESMEYDRIGKPYDVTTLQKKEETKSLVGRYLKALVDGPNSGAVLKNEYGLIIDEVSERVYADFPSQKNYSCTKSLFGKNYELMPEGFEPKKEVKKEIPEYVECISSSFNQSYAIVGRVYKFVTVSGNHWAVECNLDCAYGAGTTLYFNPEQFKPSTKEAYDRQQCIKEEKWIPKVGDWVVRMVDGDSTNKVTKGKCYQILEVIAGGTSILILNDDGKKDYFTTSNFRKAEPHEIPKTITTVNKDDNFIVKHVKINPSEVVEHFEKEIKSEIDSWCIILTKENQDLLKQNSHVFKHMWGFSDLNCFYGINKKGTPICNRLTSYFDKILTTEEFCKKFNITNPINTNPVTNTKEKPQWLEDLNDIWPQTVKKQSNKIEVKLIPVKKLIKN